MSQRSFSLANATSQAKAHRDFWSSTEERLVPSERKVEDSSEINNLEKGSGAMGLKPISPEEEFNNDTETTHPRKSTPIDRSGVAKTPGSILRPKRVPRPSEQPTELATEMPPSPSPSTVGRQTPSTNLLEKRAQPFGERYERMTTYLEKPIFRRVHDLHQRGEIAKIASLLNAAVREYLDRHYPSS